MTVEETVPKEHSPMRDAEACYRVDLTAERTQDVVTCGRLYNKLDHLLRLQSVTAVAKAWNDSIVPWQPFRRAVRKITTGQQTELIDWHIKDFKDRLCAAVDTEQWKESFFLSNVEVMEKWVGIEVAQRRTGRPIAEDETLDTIAKEHATEEIEFDIALGLKPLELDILEVLGDVDSKLFKISRLVDQLDRPVPVSEFLTVTPISPEVLERLIVSYDQKALRFERGWFLPTLPLRKTTPEYRQKVQDEIAFLCEELQIDAFEVARIGGVRVRDACDSRRLTRAPFGLHFDGKRLGRSGYSATVRLKGALFNLMEYFLFNSLRSISRRELLDNWCSIGTEVDPQWRSVRGAICRLNKAVSVLDVGIISDDPDDPDDDDVARRLVSLK